MNTINYEDFAKLDLRVCTVKEASAVEGADKLVLLKLDDGTETGRQIVAGVKKHYSPETLIGTQVIVVANLEPRKLRGIESQGMLLAASNGEELALIHPQKPIAAGSKVG
jgi:methionyl-tRNA synthetase